MTSSKPENKLAEELLEYKDTLRGNLLKFTRKAFEMLPKMEKPKILDIGCGSGIPTLELARISGGKVTAIDTDIVQLNRLEKKIENAQLSARVKTMSCSILNLHFAERSFDIIWAEGAIAVIGFEKGISEWNRLVKNGGFLVVHDDLSGLKEKMEKVSQCGYKLVGHFILNEDVWWNEYYARLEEKLNEIRSAHINSKGVIKLLSYDQQEVSGYKKDKERYRSVFFVMEKILALPLNNNQKPRNGRYV